MVVFDGGDPVKWMNYIAIVILLSACFSSEKPQPQVDPTEVTLTTDFDTSGQVYYSLKNRKVVARSSIYSWDLAFESEPGGFNIVVNSGKGMSAYNTGFKDFRIPLSPDNLVWSYDHPCGDLAQTCIGKWGDFNTKNPTSNGDLFVVNLGVDRYGRELGYKKLLIGGFSNNSYIIRFADLDGSNERLMLIEKDPIYNFTYFSFAFGGKTVKVEPPKNDWDILFTPYVDSLKFQGPADIKLTQELGLFHGILFNRNNRTVVKDTSSNWDDMTYFKAQEYDYSFFTNTIGMSWYKWVNDASKYVVNDNLYLLRDRSDNVYLLQFIDFEKDIYWAKVQFQFKNL